MKCYFIILTIVFFVNQVFGIDIYRGEKDTVTARIFNSATPYNSYDLDLRDFPDFLEFTTIEVYSLYSFYTYRNYISFELKAKENAPVVDTTFFMDFEFSISGSNFRYDTVQVDVSILEPKIVAGFTTEITEGPKPLTVNFINTSSGKFDSFYWDFGDGESSEIENPVHNYESSGTFNVTLVVSNESMADTLREESYIWVFDMPTVKITGGGDICPGDSALVTFNFTGSSPWKFTWSNGSEKYRATSNEILYSFFAKDPGKFFMVELTDKNDTTLYLFKDTVSVWINPEPVIHDIVQNTDTLFVSEFDSVQWYLNGVAIPKATSNRLEIEKSGYYFAEVFNLFGCSNFTPELFFVYSYLNSTNQNDEWITLSPNPFNDFFTISFSNDIQFKIYWELTNINGEVIKSNIISQNSNHSMIVETSELPTGIYFVRFKSANHQISRKIVKL